MSERLGWGHINVNVSDLEASISFYEKLGFELFIPGIPYLALNAEQNNQVDSGSVEALGLPQATSGRACIMQLDHGFPKLDLTEFNNLEQREPLTNSDIGVVRLCLVSQDLAADYDRLSAAGVSFISPPQLCHERLAEVATCRDPDGTLIELIQIYLDRWPPIRPANG